MVQSLIHIDEYVVGFGTMRFVTFNVASNPFPPTPSAPAGE